MNKIASLLLVVCLFSAGVKGTSSVDLTEGSPSYTENFDGLPNSGAGLQAWSLLGWYAYNGATASTSSRVSDGSTGTTGFYSYGTTSTSERSFGFLPSTTADLNLGVHIKNNDGAKTITALDISYRGEQWRKGTFSASQDILFSYSVDPNGSADLTNDYAWTYVDLLNYASPQVNAPSATSVNGNTVGSTLTKTLTVHIPAGSSIWLRWTRPKTSGAASPHGTAVDDLSVTATFAAADTAILGINVDSTTPADTDTYSTDFTNLPTTKDQYPLVNTFTSAGWYVDSTAAYEDALTYAPSGEVVAHHVFPVFQFPAAPLELGFYASNEADTVQAGFKVVNNDGSKKIDGFKYSWTGNQHYCGGFDATPLTSTFKFEYSLDATSLTTGQWTALGNTLTSLADCSGNQWLNAGDNQIVVTEASADLTANKVSPSGTIWFRWTAHVADTTETDSTKYNGFSVASASVVFHFEDGTTSASAGSSGDPHFYGFLGQKYDVMGQSYEIYNIISSPYLQINSRFTPYYKAVGQVVPTGTMMGELGIKFYSHSVFANSNDTVVIVDNQEVRIDQEWTLSFENGITISNSPINKRSVLTIETPDIVVSFIKKAYYVSGLEPQWHYDYKARILNINKEFHGLLGQTWSDKVFNNKDGAFRFLDGEENDYRVKSNKIFGDDFKFNKFQNM